MRLPSSPKTWVMPRLRPISPSFIAMAAVSFPVVCLELDFYVDTRRKIQLHQSVDGLGSGIEDIEESLVGPHLELLARGLVHVRRAQHRPAVDHGGQEHGAGDAGARAAHRLHDLLHGAVEEIVVVRLEPDADLLVGADGDHLLLRDLRHHPPPPPPESQTAAPCPSPPAGSTRSSSSRCPPASPSPPHSAACTPPSRPSSESKTAAGTR